MKKEILMIFGLFAALVACKPAETNLTETKEIQKQLFLDVHDIGPGKVSFEAVADAHKKDLAVQDQFGVNFIKYWVDEQAGKVYCLAEAVSEASVFKTHQHAHGLVPDKIMAVTDGPEAKLNGNTMFLDIHLLEPGSVTAEAVAGAHEKDLAVQKKHNVNFVNYWVDEKAGTVVCLSEAPDSLAVIQTHAEAHGLIPAKVERVKQGQ